MATPSDILADPNYVGANEATKAAIFEKKVATDPSYANANPATQAAIREKFGVKGKPAEEPGMPGVQEALGLPADSPAPKEGFVEHMTQMLRGEKKPFDGKETAGDLAGEAVGGAAIGLAAPSVLKGVGGALAKVPAPGLRTLGLGLEGAGEALSLLPPGERAVRGAGGGVAQAGVKAAANAEGVSPLISIPLETVAGGIGEAGASFLAKESGKLIKSAVQAAGGDVSGAVSSLKGILNPYKEMNAASAAKMQKTLFGEKVEGRIDALIQSDARDAAQAAMRKADPSLVGMAPASDIYRERLFGGVTKAVQDGKGFSKSPAFPDFAKKIQTLVASHELSPDKGRELLDRLISDRNPGKAVKDRYAKSVDDLIRTWGKPAEKGGQEGAAAIPAKLAEEVRGDLRQAYNKYTESVGLGKIESQYRSAYRAEKVAEAKDKIPYLLSNFGDKPELEKAARSLAGDLDTVKLLQQGVKDHLANVPVEAVPKEFLRLQKALVTSGLVQPVALRELRMAAQDIGKVTDKGVQMQAMQRFKMMVLNMAARNTAGAAGGAVAGMQR